MLLSGPSLRFKAQRKTGETKDYVVPCCVGIRTEQVIIKDFKFLYNFFRQYFIPFVSRKSPKQTHDAKVGNTCPSIWSFCLGRLLLGGNFALNLGRADNKLF